VPIAAVIPTIEASSIFSFMPIAPVIPDFGVKSYNSNEMWVFIDSFNNSIEINKGDENILTAQAKSSSGTTQGKFSVALKEENALWYANDNYFAKRSQRMPAEGSSDRYRKGALGEYAVFLSGGMVIHSSPLFDDSVTGFQVTEDEIRSIYNLLQPGTKIIIR
jgi:lipoprotein-anchoring transpeptidase ErfK/SrfK